MSFILALDQGTTSCRAILFDGHGTPVRVAQREFTQHFPQPGRVEHDAEEIYSTQLDVAEQAVREHGLVASDVAAIGITNQRETVVAWERATGRPVAHAIVWQDRRTASRCDALIREGLSDAVRKRTGLVIDAYFSATKLEWLLQNVPGLAARARAGEIAFGTIDSWLIFKLTGGAVHATDVSNASRTMLFDIETLDWDAELLAQFDIPRETLPEVRSSAGHFGEVSSGPLRGISICGVAGDQQAALFGQNCTRPGLAKNTYGTGCFALLNTGGKKVESGHRLLSTIAWRLHGAPVHYALEGSVFIAGAAVQWLRDGLGIIQKSSDVEALARSVPDSGGIHFVPAFAGIGAPHWNPHARGLLTGLTRGTTRCHIARATLEAIAFQNVDVLDAMRADAPDVCLTELRVDGGACANDLLMQIQADVLGVPVVRPKVIETTALGAAYLAGIGCGFWPHAEALEEFWVRERVFEPHMDRAQAAHMLATWRAATRRALFETSET